MQTVCDQKIFGVFPEKTEVAHQSDFKVQTMSPAEVRLQWQVFMGGLAVSGLMLLVIHVFGM